MKNIMKVFIGAMIVFVALFSSFVMKTKAWERDSGATCERVFASIKNEEGQRDWKGRVKANNAVVVSTSGTAQGGEWVTVEWTPPSNFVGTVEARVRLFNGNDVADQTEIVKELNCKSEETPTPTPEGCRPTAVKGCETPTPTEPPKHEEQGGSSNAPSYNCPFVVGEVPWFRVEQGAPNDGQLELLWSDILSADKANIYYGEEKGVMTHSVIGVEDNGHFTVGGLVNNQHYWFQMEGVSGAACVGPRTAEFDPIP